MQTQFELLATAMLELSPDEREALTQLLIASLDEDTDADYALAIEVERRIADVDNGKTKLISMSEALAIARAGLK